MYNVNRHHMGATCTANKAIKGTDTMEEDKDIKGVRARS